jgi:hypothetical protein
MNALFAGEAKRVIDHIGTATGDVQAAAPT